jgi:trehalose-6-phosphatase
MISEVYKKLSESIKDIDGARMEDNKFCVSVHYRNVAPHDYGEVHQRVTAVLKNYPCLRLTHGRKVRNIHNRTAVSKHWLSTIVVFVFNSTALLNSGS